VNQVSRLGARGRWAVPAGALAAVGIIAGVTAAASASVPSLPARTPTQLLTEAIQAISRPPGPFTATIQETANLGLPHLPQALQPSGAADVTSGTQTVNIWYGGSQHIRIAHPTPAGESDLRLDGRTLWLWDSRTQTATKVTLPAAVTGLPGKAGNRAAGSCPPATASSVCATFSPQAAARQILKALGPSTVVALDSNVKAPTGPAYQLALVPRTSQSLVSKVIIVIDGTRHLPVSVEVFGRGSAGLVYSVGFSSLSFGMPAASNFTFTPPPGATVKTHVIPGSFPAGLVPPGLGPARAFLKASGVAGGLLPGMSAPPFPVGPMPAPPQPGHMPVVPIPKKAFAQISAQFAASLPASMSKAQRAAAIKEFDKHFKVVPNSSFVVPSSAFNVGPGSSGNFAIGLGGPGNGGGFFKMPEPAAAGAPKVLGKDWLTVLATPANPQVASTVRSLLSGKGPALPTPSNQGIFGSSSSSASSSSAYSSTLTVQGGQGGQGQAVLRALLLAATPVHGSWGSGRLLQTNVLSVLITSKGQILAGAVTPAVLYADVPAAG
jgi:outer membrane lipoprotein-sorting protein